MRIFRKIFKIEISPESYDFIKCSNCGSERLHEIGEVLECVDCKGVKSLN